MNSCKENLRFFTFFASLEEEELRRFREGQEYHHESQMEHLTHLENDSSWGTKVSHLVFFLGVCWLILWKKLEERRRSKGKEGFFSEQSRAGDLETNPTKVLVISAMTDLWEHIRDREDDERMYSTLGQKCSKMLLLIKDFQWGVFFAFLTMQKLKKIKGHIKHSKNLLKIYKLQFS